MKYRLRTITVLILVVVSAALAFGCGSGSQRSDVNQQPIEPMKPGEAPDIRDSFKVGKPKG